MLRLRKMMPLQDRRRRPPCRPKEADLTQDSKVFLQWQVPSHSSSCPTPPLPAKSRRSSPSSIHSNRFRPWQLNNNPSNRDRSCRCQRRPHSSSKPRFPKATDPSCPDSLHHLVSCRGPGCPPRLTLGPLGRLHPSSNPDPRNRFHQ
jgi:hypothetical protein